MKGSDAVEAERHKRFRAGKWTVSLQVALSLVLLVAANLLLRSFEKLATLDIGFDRNNVLLVNANLEAASVPPGQRLGTYDEIEQRLHALPGVTSAGRSLITPFSGEGWYGPIRPDSSVALSDHDAGAFFNAVSPGYFETLRIPLLAGRNFNDLDAKTAPQVAIVNQTFARRFYPNINPVGRYFRTDEPSGKPGPLIQVVGLSKDSNYLSLREEAPATAFLPITQLLGNDGSENFELRTATPPSALAHLVERTIAEENKGISVELRTLAQQVNDSMVQERLLAMLSGFFAILALLLAAVGLYGTFTYLVTQRQREFGIRMALGAEAGSILRLVMRDVAVIIVGGIAAGALISFGTTRVLAKLLFGLSAHDPVTFAGAVAILSAVAVVAGCFPARRATKVNPMVALRHE
jgi:predicted permease